MTTPAPRIARVERTTKESSIVVELNLDDTEREALAHSAKVLSGVVDSTGLRD